MDIFIYVGLAVLLAIVLFVALRGKKPEAVDRAEPEKSKLEAEKVKPTPKAKPEPSEAAREPEPAKREAEPEEPDEEVVAVEEDHAEPPPPPSSRGPREAPPSDARPQQIENLREGLAKSREGTGFFGKLKALFTRKGEISPEIVEEIEEVLLSSDVGVGTTQEVLSSIRDKLGRGELKDHAAVWAAVRARATEILAAGSNPEGLSLRARPTVVLMVGVNGAGKTTTIGKLATHLTARGKKCVLAAGDTFRAAAVQQLVVWGDRVGCEVVKGKDGSDPGSVIFDAVKRAEELGADVVLADTAGRLHTKRNLMAEMQKIARTIGKAMDGAPHETLLVIDATNGQNAMAQAEEFKEKLGLTGIVLTKLDGTAKGGVVLGIAGGLKVPVRFIGLGERPDDLHAFNAEDFVEALLGKGADDAA